VTEAMLATTLILRAEGRGDDTNPHKCDRKIASRPLHEKKTKDEEPRREITMGKKQQGGSRRNNGRGGVSCEGKMA